MAKAGFVPFYFAALTANIVEPDLVGPADATASVLADVLKGDALHSHLNRAAILCIFKGEIYRAYRIVLGALEMDRTHSLSLP